MIRFPIRRALLPVLLTAGLALAPAARADEAHDLATTVVRLSNGTDGFEKLLALMHGTLIRQIETGSGKSQADATRAVDGIIMPSVRAAWPTIQATVVDIYARTYSLDDLRGLVTFYRSPVGRDLVAKQPQIAAIAGPSIVTIIQDRLRQTLHDRADDLRKQGVSL